MYFFKLLRSRFRDERQFRLFLLLAAATALGVGLILARSILAHYRIHPNEGLTWPEIQGHFGLTFAFLGWNLFLAWIPYLAALRFERARRDGVAWSGALPWLALWLVFLPNAPYIITDFIHLHPRPPIPIWFDIVLLFAFASTGLLLGLLSMYEVRLGLRRNFSAPLSELLMLGAIALAGFGVWLGRFQRWNSWDVLTNPKSLARDMAYTLTNRHELIDAFGISALVGSILLVGYAMVSIMLPGSEK